MKKIFVIKTFYEAFVRGNLQGTHYPPKMTRCPQPPFAYLTKSIYMPREPYQNNDGRRGEISSFEELQITIKSVKHKQNENPEMFNKDVARWIMRLRRQQTQQHKLRQRKKMRMTNNHKYSDVFSRCPLPRRSRHRHHPPPLLLHLHPHPHLRPLHHRFLHPQLSFS